MISRAYGKSMPSNVIEGEQPSNVIEGEQRLCIWNA